MPKPVTHCLYCGKAMHEGQAFCYKCGRAPSQGEVDRHDPTRRRPRPEPEITEDASTHVGFCGYCGKELYEGQVFCPKCGRDAGLAVAERPTGGASGDLYPKIQDLRDRGPRWGWFALAFGVTMIIVGAIAWYGLWVMPRRTPAEVRPAFVDEPMVQIDSADHVEPEEPTAPTGPITTPDDAIARVEWVPEVELWLRTMASSGAHLRLTVADEDEQAYTVQVVEVVGLGEDSQSAAMGWWVVEKADGNVTQRTDGAGESPEASEDRTQVEKLAKAATDLRPDYFDATLEGNWAFVDIGEKDDQGGWAAATAVMLRNTADGWRVVAEGDPMDWTMQRTQMPPEAQQAFDTWHLGHL